MQRRKLSVNCPVVTTVLTVFFGLFFLALIGEQLNQWKPRVDNVVFYSFVIIFLCYHTGRFWFSPGIHFDETGIYIKRFRQPVLFVPFSDVSRLKGLYNFFIDSRSKYRRFELYYNDAHGAGSKVRIMLHYHQHLFSGKPVLLEFLELAEGANKNFVYDNSLLGPSGY